MYKSSLLLILIYPLYWEDNDWLFWTVIVIFSYRDLSQSRQKDKVMFPEVTRKEADKDLIHCAKYIINYGFYKFGVEV